MREKIGPRILDALLDCQKFRSGNYVWKRKSMEKAVALGLAKEVPHNAIPGTTAFELTDSGRKAISSVG